MESWRKNRLVDAVTVGEDKPIAAGEMEYVLNER